MRTIRVRKFDALMGVLREEFAKGQVYLATIDSEGEVAEGLCEGDGNIYIDPAPSVVETLIHELLHRRYPEWTERRVSDTAHRFTTAMSTEERMHWYHAFRRRAKKIGRVVKVEA